MSTALPGGDQITVLVIDDHEMVAESLVRLLSEDHRLLVLGSQPTGTAGIARAIALRPDVVIMDFEMPDMDGAAATRELLARVPSAKVIVLTGSGRPETHYASAQAGASAWLSKTRAVHDLTRIVHRVHAGEVDDEGDAPELPTIDELVVHYQPVVDIESERVVGFEALVRWQHPSLGLIYPNDFLPLAEQTRFIVEIGQQVTDVATRQLMYWQQEYAAPDLWMSVNLSAINLQDDDLIDRITIALEETEVDPQRLVFEITETVLLDETEETFERLSQLRDIGVRLALDDFGTAFSSLSYLRRFPFDHIKIDNSFTADLLSSPRSVLLVEAIAQLASTLDLTCIAEGVEMAEQAECLFEHGWTLAQGYHYARD